MTREVRRGLAWMGAALPAVLVTLHALGLLPLVWRTTVLTDLQPATGHAYTVALPLGYPALLDPRAIVKENGVVLPFPSMPGWAIVGQRGQGRYHLGGGQLYLSATDNSDPRSNGRRYTIEYPWPIPRRMVQLLWLIGVVGLGLGLIFARAPIIGYLQRPPFWTLAVALGLMMLANRLWVFTDYPIVAVHPDSGGYYAIAEQLGSGVLPNFGNRPPMYPLFLKAVFSIQDRLLALAAAQSLTSFAGALTLVYGAVRWSPALGVPATVMLALYLFGFQSMEHDTAMLSESLYASFLMFAFGGLIAGLRQARPHWLAWASASMGFAILTRPAGMFLLVTFAIVAAWLLWRRYPRAAIAAFAIPLPLLMLSMSYYNLRVVRAFAPTTWGEANLAVATFLYWETDPSYPPEINADIERIRKIIQGRYEVTGKDRGLLDRSWHPGALGEIYVESFNAAALDIAQLMGGHYETTGRYWIRRIAFDSIAKHPLYYGKFVYAMLFNYFRPAPDYDFRLYLQNRAWVHYVARTFAPEKGNGIMTQMAKELAAGIPRPPLVIASFDTNDVMDLQDRVLLPATWMWRVYHFTHRARQLIFERWIWTVGIFAGLLSSAYVLLRYRLRHDGAFVVFIVTVSALGGGLVVSLVEFSQPRYSYPMEWTYAMSAVLLPLLGRRFAERQGGAAR